MTDPSHVDCSCRFCSAMRSGHLSPAMGVPAVDDGELVRLHGEIATLRELVGELARWVEFDTDTRTDMHEEDFEDAMRLLARARAALGANETATGGT